MTTPVKPYRKPEAKTIAAPIGGGLGGALVPFIVWILGVYVWDAPSDASHAIAAAAAVPPPITGMITFVVPAALALAAAYWAPHTHRPDLAAETTTADWDERTRHQIDHLDERIATPLEHMDATLTEVQAAIADQDARMQHTQPMPQWPDPTPEVGLRIMDEAHD